MENTHINILLSMVKMIKTLKILLKILFKKSLLTHKPPYLNGSLSERSITIDYIVIKFLSISLGFCGKIIKYTFFASIYKLTKNVLSITMPPGEKNILW